MKTVFSILDQMNQEEIKDLVEEIEFHYLPKKAITF